MSLKAIFSFIHIYTQEVISILFQCLYYQEWISWTFYNMPRWSTVLEGREMNLYCVLVGYTDYVSINVKVDSSNIIRKSAIKSLLHNSKLVLLIITKLEHLFYNFLFLLYFFVLYSNSSSMYLNTFFSRFQERSSSIILFVHSVSACPSFLLM